MKVDIVVPSMGESITEAIVGNIIKPNGSLVGMDEEVIELETDKVNQLLYAPVAGVVNISVGVDDTVTIGQVIGHIETEGASISSPGAPPIDATQPQVSEPPPVPISNATAPTPAAAPAAAPVEAGHNARMTKDAYLTEVMQPPAPASAPAPTPAAAPAPATATPANNSRETRRRMPRIRQVIAQRLVEAQQTTAMLTTFNEVDMSEVMSTRSNLKEDFLKTHDTKLGFMSFFVKAAVSALRAFPDINSYIDGTDIVRREYFHVGIAVGTDRGLVVPVLRDCDKLSFAQIEQGIVDFAKQARDGSLSVDDLEGGGFTITNGGIYGSLLSTPILNTPQSGILGMHAIKKRPMVVNDEIVIRPMMYLALSYDHRIVDGKEAVSFLVHMKDCLEDPKRLLLEI